MTAAEPMTAETKTAEPTTAGPEAPRPRTNLDVAPHPTETQPRRYSIAERLYLPLIGGMMVTLKHFVGNLLGRRKSYTIEYPEERREYSHRYRGHHILTTRPDGSIRCVACFLCAQACPADCIHIEAGEHPDENIEKYPLVYEIDMLRCVFCGYCVDACPEEAIIMSNNYDMAYFNREQSIVGKDGLVKPYTFDEDQLGYRPSFPEEEVRRAKMRRDAFDLVSAARAHSEGTPAAPTAEESQREERAQVGG